MDVAQHLRPKMRPLIFHFRKETQNAHISSVFKYGNLRQKLRSKCNGFLTATAKFLRRLISESDQTITGGETSKTRSVHAVDSLPESLALLPWMDLGTNGRSFAAQKRRSANRRAEVLGMNNPYADVDKNNVGQYPEARDIRPRQLKTRHVYTLGETRSCGIVRRGGLARKRISKEERRTQNGRSILSNQKKDLDIYVIPPSVRMKQRRRQSKKKGNMVAGTKESLFERAVRDRRLCGKAERRLHSRKCEEDRKVDWVKYERDRKMWPVCQKRRREHTIEGILEEPELKLRRMRE